MLFFQILVTTLAGILLTYKDYSRVKKLLLFLAIEIVYSNVIFLLPVSSPFDFYFISNTLQIIAFLVILDYRSEFLERCASIVLMAYLCIDTTLIYLDLGYLSGLWVGYISCLKGDVFLLWILTVTLGDQSKEKSNYLFILLMIWFLAGVT